MALRSAFLALGVVALVSLQAGWSPALGEATKRHSGTVLKVEPQAGALTLEEMGVAGKLERLDVKVPPDARVVRSERIPDNDVKDLQHPFKDTQVSLKEIRPGDFVTVELGDKSVAKTVTVTLGKESK